MHFVFFVLLVPLCLHLYSTYECDWLLAHVGTFFLAHALPRATANLAQSIEAENWKWPRRFLNLYTAKAEGKLHAENQMHSLPPHLGS